LPESTKLDPPVYQTGASNFCSFEQELSTLYSIHVLTHFGDSTGELTTSSMKKGDPSTNGSNLNKNNIIKPTLDHLSEEDRKALKAYHKKVNENFLLHYKVIRQGLVQRDASSIGIRKSEVTPKVRSNPSIFSQ
jgi:hypothetical protein